MSVALMMRYIVFMKAATCARVALVFGTERSNKTMTDKIDIYQALNAVMHEVGYVQKKRSGGVNYSFAGEAALIEAVRPAMVAHGIVVHPHQVVELIQDTYTTSKGSVMNRTTVIMIYNFVHAPTGSQLYVTVTGEGADIGDKSANKALTGAYKYALRQALMIETGDDPDKFDGQGPDNEPAWKQRASAEKNNHPGTTAKPIAVPGPTGAKVATTLDTEPDPASNGNGKKAGKKGSWDGDFIKGITETVPRYSGQRGGSYVVQVANKLGLKPDDTQLKVENAVTTYAELRDANVSGEKARIQTMEKYGLKADEGAA
jgi:hypothetical protein